MAKRGNGSWYYVEKRTAKQMMEFLASVVAKKLEMLPATDKYKFSVGFAKGKVQSDRKSRFVKESTKKREIILKNLMPFPVEIDMLKLRRFKDTHLDLLRDFRSKVEQIAFNSAIEPSSQVFEAHIDELVVRKEELLARMSESKFKQIIFGTICGVTAAGISLATVEKPVDLLLAAPSFFNAVYSSVQIERPEHIVDQSGLKYVALLDRMLNER